MPTLDVTDVLFDPDFCDFNLWVTRRVQTVDDDGSAATAKLKRSLPELLPLTAHGEPPYAVRASYQWRDSYRDK